MNTSTGKPISIIKAARIEQFNMTVSFERSRGGWLALAAILNDGEWHDKLELGEAMSQACDILPASGHNLLRQAKMAGYVSQDMQNHRRKYRVSDEGRRQRPELRVV